MTHTEGRTEVHRGTQRDTRRDTRMDTRRNTLRDIQRDTLSNTPEAHLVSETSPPLVSLAALNLTLLKYDFRLNTVMGWRLDP